MSRNPLPTSYLEMRQLVIIPVTIENSLFLKKAKIGVIEIVVELN